MFVRLKRAGCGMALVALKRTGCDVWQLASNTTASVFGRPIHERLNKIHLTD